MVKGSIRDEEVVIIFMDKWTKLGWSWLWKPSADSVQYSHGPLDGIGLCQRDLFQIILGTKIWELAMATETFQIGIFPTASPFQWEGERVKCHGCSIQEGLYSRDWPQAHWMSCGTADISSTLGSMQKSLTAVISSDRLLSTSSGHSPNSDVSHSC